MKFEKALSFSFFLLYLCWSMGFSWTVVMLHYTHKSMKSYFVNKKNESGKLTEFFIFFNVRSWYYDDSHFIWKEINFLPTFDEEMF